MSVRRFVARRVPSPVVRWLGRLQFKYRSLGPLIRWAAAGVRTGEGVIASGVGKGLRFDPSGGNPGYAMGTSDMPEQELMAATLRAGQVFYDIGANVGFFSTIGGRIVGPTGHVYAFEPFPESADAARRNAERNGMAQVTVFQFAVSGQEAQGQFVMGGSGAVSFHLDGSGREDVPDVRRIPVRVVTIDAMLARGELRPPHFVMIDVEGAELDVIAGMRDTLLAHRPTVVCEVHWIGGASFLEHVRQTVGDAYRVTLLDGSPVRDVVERYHVLMRPTPPP